MKRGKHTKTTRRDYLIELLNGVDVYEHPNVKALDNLKPPHEVARAMKIAETWNRSRHKNMDTIRRRERARIEKLKRLIIMSDDPRQYLGHVESLIKDYIND